MRYAICLFVTALLPSAFAHEGHGHSAASSPWHLLEPIHLAATLGGIAALAALYRWRTRPAPEVQGQAAVD